MLTSIFGNVLLISIMSALLVLLIMLAKLILKDRLSAAWHYYIWFLLILRLVVPYTPEISAEWFSSAAAQISENYSRKDNPGGMDKTAVREGNREKNKNTDIGNELDNTMQEEYVDMFDGYVIPVNNIPFDIMETAGIVWAAGVLILLVYMLLVNVLMNSRIQKAAVRVSNNNVDAIVEECRKLLSIKRSIPVIYQQHIKAPALFGLLRPKLLMPHNIPGHLDGDEIKHIILHELCHYKRKDIFTSTLLIALNILHWFNPAIWFAVRRIYEDREPVCDKLALEYINTDERKKYAITLVKILEIFSGSYPVHNTAGIIQGKSKNMAWRLKLIKGMKKKSTVLGSAAVLLIVIPAAAGFSLLKGNIGFARAPETQASVDEPLSPAASEVKAVNGRGRILDRNGFELVERNSGGSSHYPLGNLASHVIGYVGESKRGVFGIEAFLDNSGAVSDNVTLTIDRNIQKIAEDALEEAIKDYKLMNGAASVIIDPSTGEILAMVSKPDFDLNRPLDAPANIEPLKWKETVLKNKAISETYEPGSTFKAIVAAAGFEEKLIKADTPVDDSTVTVAGYPINCWRPNGHGRETFAEAVYNSCNPVFVRLAQELGKERFYKYVREFGFYDKTGIDIPGETGSLIHRNPMEIDMAAASFGQRFQITPLQLASAYGAVANGGDLLKPRIIKEISDSEGRTVKQYGPEILSKVISKQTSDELKKILEGAVEKGTGKNAFIEGYRIAGKTGTSETAESVSKGRYIASFAGFAPADEPKIVCLVVFDGPQVYPHTGGMTATPVAGRIIKYVLDYMDGKADQ